MAITYTRYNISDVDTIGAALVSAIDASGMYDSASYNDSTKIVTIADNGTTYCTITLGVTCYINTYSDLITTPVSATLQSTSYIAIATVGSSVFMSVMGGWRCSIIFTKSVTNMNMILHGIPDGDNHYCPITIAKDTTSAEIIAIDSLGVPYRSSSLLSSFLITAPIMCESSSETAVIAKSVYRINRMPDVIAYPWTSNAIYNLTQVVIGNKVGLTDGLFVTIDDSE